jgi:TolB-like protein/DNA-binding SARP family transcriptional activator
MGSAADEPGTTTPPTRWRLVLFGGVGLSRPGGDAVPLSGRRERALLAYLALRPNCREKRRALAAVLWGDADDPTLLDNLRTSLWGLRRALNDSEHRIIVSQDDWIALDAAAFDVDAWNFRRLAGQTDRASLEAAAALYTGEFLAGLAVDSEEFQSWARDEAARFGDLAIDVLDRLTGHFATAGEVERAIDSSQRILRFDPLHEGAVRRLIRLYADTGRRGAAFQLYRSLSERLKSELDAEPEAETRRLIEEISRGADPAPPAAPAATPAPPPAAPSLPPPSAVQAPVAGRARRGMLLWGGVGTLALVVAAAVAVFSPPLTRAPETLAAPGVSFSLPEKPSIAVLPFASLSGDKTKDDLADALTTDIATALSIISEMFVIDRGSTSVFRDTSVPVAQIATQLGVRYVLEGSVQRSTDRVRVSAQLVDTISRRQIWADRYDREVKDTFDLQDEITLAILAALQVQLTGGEQDRISLVHGTQNLQAWVIAGQGRELLRHVSLEDTIRARELYRQAATLDPNFPGAVAGLAWSYLLTARFGWSDKPAADLAMAAELGQRALALDPMRSRTYALLGNIKLMLNDHAEAVTYSEKAVALDPNGSEVAAMLALTLTYTDGVARSPDLIARAMRLSPYYPDWYRWALGRSYRLLGRYPEAESVLATTRNTSPLKVPPMVELAATYAEQGKESEAHATAKAILSIAPRFTVAGWTSNPPYQNLQVAEREKAILRRAGLPDK